MGMKVFKRMTLFGTRSVATSGWTSNISVPPPSNPARNFPRTLSTLRDLKRYFFCGIAKNIVSSFPRCDDKIQHTVKGFTLSWVSTLESAEKEAWEENREKNEVDKHDAKRGNKRR